MPTFSPKLPPKTFKRHSHLSTDYSVSHTTKSDNNVEPQQSSQQSLQPHVQCSHTTQSISAVRQEENTHLHVARVSLQKSHMVKDCNVRCPLPVPDSEVVSAIFDSDGGILSSKHGDVKKVPYIMVI